MFVLVVCFAAAVGTNIERYGAAVYGDPHFHIKGKNDYQPDLCFDFLNKKSDTSKQHLLVNDNETGFSVYAQTFKPFAHSDQIYFRDLWLTSRNNITLHVTSDRINLGSTSAFNQKHIVEPSVQFASESTKYGDVILGKVKRKGNEFSVSMVFINGPSLSISTGKHQNVNVVFEGGYMSQNLSGILGPFLIENGYRIIQDEDEPSTGYFFADNLEAEVSFHRHNQDKNCWTLSDKDVQKFMHHSNVE